MSNPVLLPTFGSVVTCPKCGSAEKNTTYCAGDQWLDGGVRLCPHSVQGEHLERRCARCAYWWLESTITAQEQP